MADDDPTADLTIGPPGAVEIDAELATPPDADLGDDQELDGGVGVDPATIRTVLELGTNGLHIALGHPEIPDHWRASDVELLTAASALARIASRSPVLTRALGGDRGDGLVLALVGGQYVIRNVSAGRALKEDDDDGLGDEDGDRVAGGDPADPAAAGQGWPTPHGGGSGFDGAAPR